MELKEAIRQRWSVREFSAQSIPREALYESLAVGLGAPNYNQYKMIIMRLTCILICIIAFGSGNTSCGAVPIKTFMESIEVNGERCPVLISKPDDDEKYPLIIINHGVSLNERTRKQFARPSYFTGMAEFFSAKGFVVAYLNRPGYGMIEKGFNETEPDYAWGRKLNGVENINVLLKYMTEKKYVDDERIISIGHSGGGFYSLLLAVEQKYHIIGVIAYSHGYYSDRGKMTEMYQAHQKIGQHTKIPELWFAYKNDVIVPNEMTMEQYERFVKGGGSVKLNIFEGNHNTFFNARLNWPHIRNYFKLLGLSFVDD